MKRENFVKECRKYLDTPFLHQGRIPGVGIDCAGVVICASKKLGQSFEDTVNYSRNPSQENLLNKIKNSGLYDVELKDAIPGDILLMAYNGNVQHIAVITENSPDIYILHAVNGKSVIEHRLNEAWKEKIRRVFRFNELEKGE